MIAIPVVAPPAIPSSANRKAIPCANFAIGWWSSRGQLAA
jgi:hypothetical protein